MPRSGVTASDVEDQQGSRAGAVVLVLGLALMVLNFRRMRGPVGNDRSSADECVRQAADRRTSRGTSVRGLNVSRDRLRMGLDRSSLADCHVARGASWVPETSSPGWAPSPTTRAKSVSASRSERVRVVVRATVGAKWLRTPKSNGKAVTRSVRFAMQARRGGTDPASRLRVGQGSGGGSVGGATRCADRCLAAMVCS